MTTNDAWKQELTAAFKTCMPEFFAGTSSFFVTSDPPEGDDVVIEGSAGTLVFAPLALKQSKYTPEQAALRYRAWILEQHPELIASE